MKEQGSPLYQLTLLVLSIFVLASLLLEAFIVENEETRAVLQYIDFSICLVFLTDFFVNLFRAESKLNYLKWGWIDFFASIPAIDPLRWGRVTRMVRILRYFRAVRSVRILLSTIKSSRFETLSWSVFLIVFLSYTVSAALILEFEGTTGSVINSAEAALWWAFLNIMNAKTAIDQAISPQGVLITVFLNKIGLLLFAYLNSIIIAWLVMQRPTSTSSDNVGSL